MALPDETPLDNLPVITRTRNALHIGGYHTAGAIRRAADNALLMLPNFGRRSLMEVRELLGRTSPEVALTTEEIAALRRLLVVLRRVALEL
jgi:DNA-directed RNA polymerase alpha subunit